MSKRIRRIRFYFLFLLSVFLVLLCLYTIDLHSRVIRISFRKFLFLLRSSIYKDYLMYTIFNQGFDLVQKLTSDLFYCHFRLSIYFASSFCHSGTYILVHFIAYLIWSRSWIFHLSISKFISILVLMFWRKSLLFP